MLLFRPFSIFGPKSVSLYLKYKLTMKKLIFALLLTLTCGSSFSQNIKWALQDVKNAESFHNGIASFYEKRLYGAIDRTGEVVIEPRFQNEFKFIDGSAVIKTEQGGYGIINRQGIYLLEPIYSKIEKCKEADNLYVIVDADNNKGVFYNNRMVLPVESKSISTYSFPIISFSGGRLNLVTGEVFKFGMVQGNVNLMYDISEDRYYYDALGEPLDPDAFMTSSKGVTLVGEQNDFGFVNKFTGDTIRHKSNLFAYIPFFVDDVMVFVDNDDEKRANILVDASGEVVIGPEKQLSSIQFFSPTAVLVIDRENKWGLYSTSGKELLPIIYNTIMPFGNDTYIFISDAEQGLYVRKTDKKLSGYKMVFSPKDDMCQMIKIVGENEVYGYINCLTGAEIVPRFKYAETFSEGLAKVTVDGETYFFIDKNGRTVLSESSQLEFRGAGFSEGVLAVYEKGTGRNSFIYNPVRKSDYTYNQKVFSDATVDEWFDAGQREFDRGRYTTAKEHYYKVMMAQPANLSAIINYGACLANMGHIDEALEIYSIALDIDPENKLTQNNVAACKRELHNRATAQQQQQQKGSFWNALYMFCSVVYDSYAVSSTDGMSSSGGSVPSGQSCSYYQNRYNELKSKRDAATSGNSQRSATATGKNAAHSIAPDRASAATSGDYRVINSANALVREYERQMESVRNQARQAGCSVY